MGRIPGYSSCNTGNDIKKLAALIPDQAGPAGKGVDMGFDMTRAREVHFTRMQKALEDGLTNINLAKTPDEADAARQRAQARIEELNKMFEDAFPKEESEV